MKVVQKREHHRDCFMAHRYPGRPDHRPGNPWCLDYKNPQVSASANGRMNGNSTSWIRVRCLDPKCDALLLVEEFPLWEHVNQTIMDGEAHR